jgi:hypothetical protein
MAIIPQRSLFSWEEIEELGDLERLMLVMEYLPDEELMRRMERQRGQGRDDYPVRAVWNSVLAGVVFGHDCIESLRRELKRNGQLRQLCGFNGLKGVAAVPPAWVYTRFLKSLMRHMGLIEGMFDFLVDRLGEALPGFGETLAVDGKGIETHAKAHKDGDVPREPDGRRDLDADWGVKTYQGERENGTLWQKLKSWFGYKLHLVVDAHWELPVAFEVTRASGSEVPEAHRLVNKLEQRHPELLDDCEVFLADRGLDDGKLIERLWDEHGIKPVIDIRNMWKDSEATRLVTGARNVVYDYKGTVYCHCPKSDERYEMAYGGFEKDRGCLKYRCPARHYGLECAGSAQCTVGFSVRIPLSEDRRIFTPLARSSYAWKRQYKKRTAVERVNSRLDVSFGFEHHFIRGLEKMKLRCCLALCVMLAMALGRVRQKQQEKLRSLVRAAA